MKTADVSPSLETIASCNYSTPQASLRNRTQEADGSIPFISTKVLLVSSARGSAVIGDKSGVTVTARPSAARSLAADGRAVTLLQFTTWTSSTYQTLVESANIQSLGRLQSTVSS